MASWLRSAVDLDPDEDLDDDLPPPPDSEAPAPEDADDDLPPWHHPDPWTAEQARDAYWERAEELARG